MPLEIHTMKLGESIDDDWINLYLDSSGKKRKSAYYSFYIKGADVPIIVDTFMRDPKHPPMGSPVITRAGWGYLDQLRKLGVDPNGVGVVIHTHLHYDHCGNDGLFPNAKIYIQREELTSALTLNDVRSLELFDRRDLSDLTSKFGDRVVLIDGDYEIAEGVKCVRFGGHTAGSQAIYVETSGGTAIITGDICYQYDNLEKSIPTGIFYRYDECIDAIRRIKAEGKYVLVGHDRLVYERFAEIPPH